MNKAPPPHPDFIQPDHSPVGLEDDVEPIEQENYDDNIQADVKDNLRSESDDTYKGCNKGVKEEEGINEEDEGNNDNDNGVDLEEQPWSEDMIDLQME